MNQIVELFMTEAVDWLPRVAAVVAIIGVFYFFSKIARAAIVKASVR